MLTGLTPRIVRWRAAVLLLVPATAAALELTAGGFRYDLNHKKWHGLDSGNSFGF